MQAKGMYISQKKSEDDATHTHKPGHAYETKLSPKYRRNIYMSATHFVCSSCLFVACNVTVEGNVKVSKLWNKMLL